MKFYFNIITLIFLFNSSFISLVEAQSNGSNLNKAKSLNNADSANLAVISNNIKAEREKYFYENKGQLADENSKVLNNIQFYGELSGVSFYFHKNGINYKFSKREKRKAKLKQKVDPHLSCANMLTDSIITNQMDMELLDADTGAIIIKENPSKSYSNFYYSHCPAGVLNVRGYNAVIYKNIYPKIDMKVYHFEGKIKYDFIVHPGGNPNKIRMKFKGHDSIKINSAGNLEVKNPLGKVIEEAPFSYQIKNGKKEKVSSNFTLNNDIVSFKLSKYEINSDIIIDPTRIWGTYWGGSTWDLAHDIKLDTDNNIYITGHRFFEINNGESGFAAKFNNEGQLIWSTFYSGDGLDDGYALVIDNSTNIYITGITASTDFLTSFTSGRFKSIKNSNYDSYILKLNNTGFLQYATLYGGDGDDRARDIVLDINNNIYIVGKTTSINNIATTNTSCTSSLFNSYNANSGNEDVFIAKFNNTLVTRLFGTYLGGPNDDGGEGIILDDVGNIYITGYTNSNSIQSLNNYGSQDAFIAKINSCGANMVWFNYFGGSNLDYGYGIALDKFNNAYITGFTQSPDLCKSCIHQPLRNNTDIVSATNQDGFIAKYNSSGSLLWSTYIGGSKNDQLNKISIAKNGTNNIFVTGTSKSNNYPITLNAFKPSLGVGVNGVDNEDVVISELNPSGFIANSTYFGGNGKEYAGSIIPDEKGNLYITGGTQSNTTANIATFSAFQNAYSSNIINNDGEGGDIFLAKFDFNNCNDRVGKKSPEIINAIINNTCSMNSVTVILDKNIYCSSIQPADFKISTPSTNYSILGVTSDLCTAGEPFSNQFIITFSPAITRSEDVLIELQGNIRDICGQLAYIHGQTLDITYSSELSIITDIQNTCGERQFNLCVSGTTSTGPFTWTKDGVVLTGSGFTGSCITVTEPGNYSVTDNTNSNCIKIAEPVCVY